MNRYRFRVEAGAFATQTIEVEAEDGRTAEAGLLASLAPDWAAAEVKRFEVSLLTVNGKRVDPDDENGESRRWTAKTE